MAFEFRLYAAALDSFVSALLPLSLARALARSETPRLPMPTLPAHLRGQAMTDDRSLVVVGLGIISAAFTAGVLFGLVLGFVFWG